MLMSTSSSVSSVFGTAKSHSMKSQTEIIYWIKEFSSSAMSSALRMDLSFITMPPGVQAISPSGHPP